MKQVSDEDAARKDDTIGVLFVHGIGQQQQGVTLLRWGEALRVWQSRWWNSGLDEEPSTRIAVVDTSFGPAPHDRYEPAHSRWRVTREKTEDPTAKDWLFAEAWWAQEFIPPSYAHLTRWAVQVFPWTLGAHLIRGFRHTVSRVEGRGRFATAWAVGVALLGFFIGLALLPLLILALCAVLALSLIPIAPVRRVGAWLQRGLAASVGDSLVLLDEDVQQAAILGKVRRDLAWLRARCSEVVVVAHSQGAAIAHQVIHALDDSARPSGLLTFGSGVAKLTTIRLIREADRAQPWMASFGLLLAILQLVFFDPPIPSRYDLFAPVLLFVVGFAGMMKSRIRVEDVRLDGVPWTDVYSHGDAVPNGALLQDDAEGQHPRSVGIENGGLLLLDHIRYWQNWDQFLPEASRFVFGSQEACDADRIEVAADRRAWRVRWLVWGRRVIAACAVLTFVSLMPAIKAVKESLPSVGKWVVTAFEGLTTKLPLVPSLSWSDSGHRAWLVALGVGVGWLVVSVGVWAWWGLWDWRDRVAFFRRRSFAFPVTALFLTVWIAAAAEFSVAARLGLLVSDFDTIWSWLGPTLIPLVVGLLGGALFLKHRTSQQTPVARIAMGDTQSGDVADRWHPLLMSELPKIWGRMFAMIPVRTGNLFGDVIPGLRDIRLRIDHRRTARFAMLKGRLRDGIRSAAQLASRDVARKEALQKLEEDTQRAYDVAAWLNDFYDDVKWGPEEDDEKLMTWLVDHVTSVELNWSDTRLLKQVTEAIPPGHADTLDWIRSEREHQTWALYRTLLAHAGTGRESRMSPGARSLLEERLKPIERKLFPDPPSI